VTPIPHFRFDSSRIGWGRTHFAHLECARAGHVVQLHAHYPVQRNLHPFRARQHGTRTRRAVPPGSVL